MGRDVTVVAHNEEGSVTLAYLKETGRQYYHVRFVRGADLGIVKIAKSDVDLIDGHRYDLFGAYLDRARAALEWQTNRAMAVQAIETSAEAKIEKQVEQAIKRWDREHPRPDVRMTESDEPEPEPEPEPENVSLPVSTPAQITPIETNDGYALVDAQPSTVDDLEVQPGRPWQQNDLVIIKESWTTGTIIKVETEESNEGMPDWIYYVSVHDEEGKGRYPQRFVADELEGPDRQHVEGPVLPEEE